MIDVWRTDIAGEFTPKDKKGEWIFAGLPYTGEYVVSVSAPGASRSQARSRPAGKSRWIGAVTGDGKLTATRQWTAPAAAELLQCGGERG